MGRAARASGWKVLAAAAAMAALAGCNLGGSSSSGVTRYEGKETAVTGALTIASPVMARKAADPSADPVQTLQPGTGVSRKAEFGNFTLVSWTGPDGAQQEGWIETSSVTNVTPQSTAAKFQPPRPQPKPAVQPTATAQPNCSPDQAWNGTECAPVKPAATTGGWGSPPPPATATGAPIATGGGWGSPPPPPATASPVATGGGWGSPPPPPTTASPTATGGGWGSPPPPATAAPASGGGWGNQPAQPAGKGGFKPPKKP